MKNLNFKKFTLNLGFLAGSLVSFFHSVPALAGRTVVIPAIQVQKTGNYLGQYATIYYGFEKTAIINADSSLISLSSVRSSQTRPIAGDTVQFPSVQIDKEGIRGAYDTVVVVISRLPNFSWKNADGTFPTGVLDTKIYEASNTSFHKATQLDAYTLANKTAAFYPWPLNPLGTLK